MNVSESQEITALDSVTAKYWVFVQKIQDISILDLTYFGWKETIASQSGCSSTWQSFFLVGSFRVTNHLSFSKQEGNKQKLDFHRIKRHWWSSSIFQVTDPARRTNSNERMLLNVQKWFKLPQLLNYCLHYLNCRQIGLNNRLECLRQWQTKRKKYLDEWQDKFNLFALLEKYHAKVSEGNYNSGVQYKLFMSDPFFLLLSARNQIPN